MNAADETAFPGADVSLEPICAEEHNVALRRND